MSLVTIIDYGAGNLHSAAKAFERMRIDIGQHRGKAFGQAKAFQGGGKIGLWHIDEAHRFAGRSADLGGELGHCRRGVACQLVGLAARHQQ